MSLSTAKVNSKEFNVIFPRGHSSDFILSYGKESGSCSPWSTRVGAWHPSAWACYYIYEYCFTSLSAQSWQYRDRRKPEAGIVPYSYFEWLQGFFIVHSTIGSTVHSMILNSLEHCICTTTITNVRPDRDSNLVPPGYKPQSTRMSHRGRSACYCRW